ncbi:GNAT family N-acetyltransferase [Anaerotignum lactatifermentans]|uniref:GNAT family N-acetyltransferase n=1 Tax=Anaerotignum lactatifermentans TaxID=160404 RepID=A0ABS2G5H8_9FIRM|nr:GNAT family N-acetyltransferase [Anaerotignum lactatifermentans]MBM6828168.1 GNAT family N-acetyltransferase [Anaerotignum lactatifermentans]MBM6876669.1 GNAT family N-acetyltransferase [Anaerotignum lactatifermentans]MBM6949751.1 GNAT family N-acetyltransferase [Anaerotignum lactatifermentans]
MREKIVLVRAKAEDWKEFAGEIQAAFAIALEEHYGPQEEPVPEDTEIRKAFAAEDRDVYYIFQGDQKVGGAVIRRGQKAMYNELELFYISPAYHSRGVGLAAWQAIERAYPQTKVWETITPYFEQRNIHFYLNKCGFQAVEFFNRMHPGRDLPMGEDGDPMPGTEAFFRFEKHMQ